VPTSKANQLHFYFIILSIAAQEQNIDS